ncbi:hypothetical protein PIB30_115408, partial [Stylosanthes scabra]|nr:hypothetical protein [Stylosanthes scabra]
MPHVANAPLGVWNAPKREGKEALGVHQREPAWKTPTGVMNAPPCASNAHSGVSNAHLGVSNAHFRIATG